MDRKENAKLIKGFIGTFFFYTGLLSIEYDGMRCCLLDFLESLPYNGISLGFCKTQLTGIRECIKDQDSTLAFFFFFFNFQSVRVRMYNVISICKVKPGPGYTLMPCLLYTSDAADD